MKRQASDKPFIEQPAVGNNFGSMGRVVESWQARTEQLIYKFERVTGRFDSAAQGRIRHSVQICCRGMFEDHGRVSDTVQPFDMTTM